MPDLEVGVITEVVLLLEEVLGEVEALVLVAVHGEEVPAAVHGVEPLVVEYTLGVPDIGVRELLC